MLGTPLQERAIALDDQLNANGWGVYPNENEIGLMFDEEAEVTIDFAQDIPAGYSLSELEVENGRTFLRVTVPV